MGIIDDIKDTVMGWIDHVADIVKSYAYGLYESVWSYASQISEDLWHETGIIWERLAEIPLLTEEVIKGWVTPWIETAKEYALGLVNDAVDIYDIIINGLNTTIEGLEDWKEDVVDVKLAEYGSWITEAPSWFTTQLEAYKDVVVGFIIDKFEYILDQVFKEEEK